ncbi:MAG: PhnD/SsuA/transferrin family substrate-binding protein [Rudaea sp.]
MMQHATTNRSRQRSVSLGVLCLLSGILCHQAIAAEYTFRIEPAFPPERVNEIYAPLMKYLDKATGQHFNLVAARNYHYYWRDITSASKTDFAFDEAHLTDYRIQHQHFIPLVRTAEPTGYTLVSNIDIDNKGLSALVGHTIITMSAPSLGYSLLLEFYPNPVSEPNIKTTATSWRDAVDRVFAGEADAAMIPNALKDQYPNLTPVKSTREFPGQCVTASADVPEDVREKVKQALLDLSSDAGASQVLLDLGISKFVPATAKEYAGDEQILKNEFGYK